MSFPPGVPVSIGYATSVQAVRQQPMMIPMAPMRHVTLVPASTMVMRPIMSNQTTTIRTISAPPQIMQTVSFNPPSVVTNSAVVRQHGPVLKPKIQANTDTTKSESSTQGNLMPPVTVFVSNITERASDTLVRQMLMKCGTVYAWKRVQGASGKLQAFGFCEYKDVEAALRAIYLLHDFKLGDKKLLVKVDAKTQDVLNQWKKDNGIEEPEDGSEAIPPNLDESKAGLDLLMKEYASELNTSTGTEVETPAVVQAPSQRLEDPVVRESHNVEENLKSLDLEDSEKDFISKEIRSFRSAQKLKEEEKKKEEDRKKKAERDKEKRDEERERERTKQREREREDRDREKERERSSKSTRSPRRSRTPVRRREITRSPARIRRRTRSPPDRSSRNRTPPRRRSRSRSLHGSRPKRSRSRSVHRREDDNEDDEGYERRRLERKIREKEAAYQERLRAWETRERRRKRDYEKRDERDEMIRKEMMREAKRLQEFLADYDDTKMDYKYYTGSAMMKRRREWEREKDADSRDRKKEQEEIDALRQKLIEENHPDPEAAIAKALKETEDVWQPLLKAETPPPPLKKDSPRQIEESSSSSSSSGSESDSDQDEKSGSNSSDSEESDGDKLPRARLVTATLVPVTDEPSNKAVTVAEIKKEAINSLPAVSQNGDDTPGESGSSIKMEFQQQSSSPLVKTETATTNASSPYMISKPPQLNIPKSEAVMQIPGANQRRKLKVSDVFNQDDDEEEAPKKRKLVPLEYTHEERNAINPIRSAEDKRKLVRALIDKIPTKKEDLFDFNLDWSMVDANLMEKRIQPWITKKIVEYIGEEEPTLVEFICSKILSKSSPERIYEDISMVLDDEAEVFVVKMWRLLIYETEAKKEGLTK